MSSESGSRPPLAVADGPIAELNALIDAVPLVDHHVHGILRGRLDRATFEEALIESSLPEAAAAAGHDTQVWFALRRWCGPQLGLDAHTSAEAYLERRRELANEDVASRLLPAARFGRLIVETGYHGDRILSPAEMADLGGVEANEVVRLESIAEWLAREGVEAAGYANAFREALGRALDAGAIGTKTILAYRGGFDRPLDRPTDAQVARAADAWLRSVAAGAPTRLEDDVLLRFGIWSAVDTGRPLQVHTGFGDPDLDLHRADPLLLTDFLRGTVGRCDVLLLHTYPFHREAGYLAQMFPHVSLDVGLAVNYAGARSPAILAESLELAPFTKVLFSSDAWGVPELHLLGAVLFRRGLARVLGAWVERGDWSIDDAARVVELVARRNAERIYGPGRRRGS